MSERDTAVLVGLLGVFVGWIGASSELFRFLRPGMRPYVLLAAAALIATSIASFLLLRSNQSAVPTAAEGDEHRAHPNKMVALIALPIVVGLVFAPGALGSWAAGRDRGSAVAASLDFNGARFLRQHAHDAQPPRMRVADFLTAASQTAARPLLASVAVRLTGFVTHDGDIVTINRFFIACCVADAGLVSAALDGDHSDLPDDAWVEVVARLDPVRSPAAAAVGAGATPSIEVLSIRRVGAPAKPYEYLYG